MGQIAITCTENGLSEAIGRTMEMKAKLDTGVTGTIIVSKLQE